MKRLLFLSLSITMISHGQLPQPPITPTPTAPAGPVEVNGIAAIVNGRPVTKKEIIFSMGPIIRQLAAQFPRRGPEFEKQARETQEKIIQELIDRELVLDEFKKMGGKLPEAAINEEIERQKRELYNGDNALFLEELRRSNLTMPGFRAITHDRVVVQALRAQKFANAAPPLPSEIAEEYEKIKLQIRDTNGDSLTFQKIYIPAMDERNPLATPAQQLDLAEEIVKKLKNGADFTELSNLHSRDSHSSDSGWYKDTPRTDLQPEFAALIMDPPEGTIIGPLSDPRGLTIVKVKEKKYGPVPPLSQVRDQIEQRVTRQKNAERYERWIESLRKKAVIKRK